MEDVENEDPIPHVLPADMSEVSGRNVVVENNRRFCLACGKSVV